MYSKNEASKTMYRIFAMLLTFAMVLPILVNQPSVVKASKANGNVKKVSLLKPTNTETLVLKKGKFYALKVAVQVKPNTKANKKVTFRSNKPKIASVNSKGIIKAIKNGNAVITIASKVKRSKKARLKVRVGTPTSKLTLVKALSLSVQESKTLNVAYRPKKPSYTKVIWRSSNSAIAKVDKKGKEFKYGKNCGRRRR